MTGWAFFGCGVLALLQVSWYEPRGMARTRVRVARHGDPRKVDAAKLVDALGARWREHLSASDFAVETATGTLDIKGQGRLRWFARIARPAMGADWSRRAGVVLEEAVMSEARALQKLLTKVQKRPWPAVGAETHVRVTADEVQVWWGVASGNDPAVHMRPISRQEIEI